LSFQPGDLSPGVEKSGINFSFERGLMNQPAASGMEYNPERLKDDSAYAGGQ